MIERRMQIAKQLAESMAIVLVSIFAMNASLFAGETTGASFLKIGAGSRAIGMGSAYTAVADDVSSIHWNPAGLARVAEPQISATHAQWLSDLRYGSVDAAVPALLWTAGIGVVYLSEGEIPGRDAAGNRQDDFRADDMAVTGSLSKILRPGLGVGVSAKYIRQTIADEQASGLAFDAGSQLILSPQWAVGVSVQNLGSSMKFVNEDYALPLAVSGGVAFSPSNGMTLSADLRQDVNGEETSLNVGSELWALKTVALRAGYSAALGGAVRPSSSQGKTSFSSSGPLNGIGMGLGLKLLGSQVDYALVPYGDLGDTHRLSLTYHF